MTPDYYAQEVAAVAVQAQISWDLLTLKSDIKSAAMVGKTKVTVEVHHDLPGEIIKSLSDYGIECTFSQQINSKFKFTFDISNVGC